MNSSTLPADTTATEKAFQLWSATPTPFLEDFSIDEESVKRMVEHHIALGVDGIMLGGSCGEGPWVTIEDLALLVRYARKYDNRRLRIAVQVTDNSTSRMLRHSEMMAESGADAIVIAAPYFLMNATAQRVFNVYKSTIESSPIPVIYYDRGNNDRYRVDDEHLPELLSLDNLIMVKDSSCDEKRARIGQKIRKHRPELTLLSGDEFTLDKATANGFQGGFLGGAIFNALHAFAIFDAISRGDTKGAAEIQARMNELMLNIYGGPEITAWLTGLKYFLFRLGIFSTTKSHLEYPLSDEARASIDLLFDGTERDDLLESLLAVASS